LSDGEEEDGEAERSLKSGNGELVGVLVKFAMRFSTERGVVGDDMAKCKAQRDAAKASRKKE
jgi:hypothetical protein